jgi:hypothetical protein
VDAPVKKSVKVATLTNKKAKSLASETRRSRVIRQEAINLHRALADLELKAGIFAEAEAIRETHPGPHDLSNLRPPPADTKANEQWWKAEEEWERRHAKRQEQKILRLYAGVVDSSLREALISKDREEEDAAYAFALAELDEARDDLERVTNASRPWGFPVMVAVVCVVLGNFAYGPAGAVGGVLVAGFTALRYINNWKRENLCQMAQAKQDYDLQLRIVDEMTDQRTCGADR